MEFAEYRYVLDVLKMYYKFFLPSWCAELLWHCARGSGFEDYIFLEIIKYVVLHGLSMKQHGRIWMLGFWF